MIHQHLLQQAETGPLAASYLAGAHLNEDALSAFVEGRLSETESAPLIQHLVACNSCRRFTAELVRLESETAAGEVPAAPPAPAEPGRIRKLLENLAAHVLPDSDEVFAYRAPADDFERKAEAKDKELPATDDHSEQEDQAEQKSE